MSRLVTAPRRIEFVILRTDSSPRVAPHPASRRRSYLRLRSLFQKDYPFIKPSVVRAGSRVLVNRILNEARAQKVFFDIFNTNHESILPLKKRGLIGRYLSPEAKYY